VQQIAPLYNGVLRQANGASPISLGIFASGGVRVWSHPRVRLSPALLSWHCGIRGGTLQNEFDSLKWLLTRNSNDSAD